MKYKRGYFFFRGILEEIISMSPDDEGFTVLSKNNIKELKAALKRGEKMIRSEEER